MEDFRLQQTGQEVQDILNNSATQAELAAETNRAELAEQTLQGHIDDEETRAKRAEATLQDNIDAEVLARGNADGTLQGNIDAEETRAKAAEKQNADDIDAIEGKIPSGASTENQLADKSFVNSSIATASATFRGTYNLVSDLNLTIDATEQQIASALAGAIATADNNDYCFVQIPTANDKPTEIQSINRYKFNGTVWGFEYALNNSGFTAAQWAAINSDITSGLVTKLSDLPTNAQLTTLLNGKQDTLTFDNAPTENSSNPVKSGGVYTAVKDEETRAKAAEKQNADDIDAIEGKIPSDASASNKMATAKDVTDEATTRSNADQNLAAAIEGILLLIPSAATQLNKLADKDFVNSSITTASATFRGTYNLVSNLHLAVDATEQQIAAALAGAISTADNNDYCFVQIPTSDETPTQISVTQRFKFNGTAWGYEYDLNNSGFTAAQWAAINSGITAALVTKLSALPTNTDLTTALGILTDGISAINDKIPSAASSSNKMVDTAALESYVGQIIGAIDSTFNITSTDGHVTVQITQADGVITSIAVTTSDIASAAALTLLAGRVTTAEGNISTNAQDIADLQASYAGLTQNDVVVGALPSSDQHQNIIYRQPDQDHTPPQFYSDYMWNGTTWVLMATYNNAIDPRPKKGSQNLVTSGGVFENMGALDVSELNATENPHTLATYVDLSAALAAIPSDYQKGGMTIKFVQTSDNKYVQARCMAQNFTTDVTQWQGVDDEPTAGSENLVKSGGVAFATQKSIYDYQIAGLLTASGLKANGYDGRYTIIPIQNGDTIVATASSDYSYFAIIKQLPDFSQTNPSIPYATGESRRYFVDDTQTINVLAQDAKYLLVELWRQATGQEVQNTAPLQLIINGYDYVVSKEQESMVFNNALKIGCFVPKYGQYVNITDTTITIPAGSRIIYRYKQYYTNDAAIILNRQSGAQAEFVCFDINTRIYSLLCYGELNLKSNLLVCFYVRYSNECSLPHMTYKINGNFDFMALDNPVENSNNGLVTSGSIYNYVRVNSDTERAVIGNRKKYSSNSNTTTVFLENVRLQKTHLYRLTLNAVTAFTPNENYTIKVMSANSSASLLTIAQLNGVQISNNVFYFYWEQDSALTYRIGQFGTQALNTISISLSDVTDEMSGSVFPDLWEKGVYIDNTGSLVKDAQWCVSEKIRCSLGDIIHWRSGLSTTSYQISLVLFDANDTLISYISVGAGTGGQWQRVLQIDNVNVAYCRASFYTTAADGFISIYSNSNPDDFKYIKFNQELLFSIKQAVNVKDVLYQNKHKESTLMAVLLHKGNDNIKVNDKLSLLHCTDLHGDSGNLARIVEYRNNYLTYLDDAIHTGDTVAGTINDSNPFVAVNGANTILNVAGNHEAWLNTSDTDYLATSKQVYDKIFAPSIADWDVAQPEDAATDGKCYYYKDYRNFRLIVLDNVHWHTGGNQHIIDDASVQKAWFESVLADAALNEKIVVCAMHYPPIHIVPSANVKGFNDYGVTENTDIGDGWYANDEIFDCVDDFISGDGKFAGWLIGHTHRDYIGYVKGHTNQPIVILRNCGLNSASATNKNIFGTSAQDCFNIVTFDWIDASNHLIKMVRIGNDADMYGRSKKSISFNIVNGDVLEVE